MRPTWFEIACVAVGGVATAVCLTAVVLVPYPSEAVCLAAMGVSLLVVMLAGVGYAISRWIREGARA